MRKIFSLLLAVLWVQQLWAQYNPDNPADPDVYYALTLEASPSAGGYVSPGSTLQVAEGMTVTCKAIANSGYHFVEWTDGSLVVSTEPTFDYVMPANNMTLIAVFEWEPDNPEDPDNEGYSHKIYLEASPASGGYFENNTLLVVEGKTVKIKAYPHDGYRFSVWKKDGETVSTENPMTVVMGTEDVTYTATFEYAPNNPGDPDFKEPYAVLSEGNTVLTFYYDGKKDANGGMSVGPFSNIDFQAWYAQRESITKAIFDPSFANCTSITSTAFWFCECKNLAAISGIEYLKTDNVTDMDGMFNSCSTLTSLDVSGFKTDNVMNMNCMFRSCSSLMSLDVSGFETDNVTDMGGMFDGCSCLMSLDVSGFKTDNVTNMNHMFGGCSGLASLDVTHFITNKVLYMGNMFDGCSGLTSLDVSGFKTDNVTNMVGMFYGCSGLTSLDVSGFNTDKVSDMWGMFYGCSGLTSLDVSGFKTNNVVDMGYMFYGCSGLTTIYAGDGWTTANVTESMGMFDDCTSLIGGNGTTYDAGHTDEEYARIDEDGKPGYLTDINGPLPYALLSEGNTVLTFYFDDQKTAKEGLSVGPFTTGFSSWYGNRNNIEKVVFDASFANCKTITSTEFWFYQHANLSDIIDLENLNTQNVSRMNYMFDNCSSLATLDLSHFNTSKVKSTQGMFRGCSALSSLDISHFDTSNVKDMYRMFYGCSNLTTLNVSSFNTSKVTVMGSMFRNCSSLTTLDLSNFSTPELAHSENMFAGCTSLSTIYAGNTWTTENIFGSYGSDMFTDCTNLVGGNGTPYNDSHTDYTYAHVDAEGNPGYLTYKAPASSEPYAVLINDGTVLKFFYDDKKEDWGGGMSVGPFSTSDSRPWYPHAANITSVVFDSSFAGCTTLTSTAFWFYGFSNLTSITGIEYLKTDNVKNMMEMFHGCSSLTTLDVSNFNTENVERLDALFQDCAALTSLNLIHFNTAKVTSMRDMFHGCSSLTSLDLSSFNTSNVTVMFQLFSDCSSLTSLDISNFNTAKVTSMSNLFNGCSSLTSLDVHHFVTSEVTNMQSMFYGCSSLTSLDVSNFDTSKVTEMRSMFNGCSGLTTLDLTNFNTSEVLYMNFMFNGCSGLTSLDLSSFNTAKVVYMNSMFEGCSSLATIYVSDLWTTASVTSGDYMFSGCTNLVGGNGTPYDVSHRDYTYAHIDEEGKPGYLTDKNAVDEIIIFEDANVKTICVYNWDANGDGELSYSEAAAVTDIGTVFQANTTITTFNELQFFTGLTAIANYAFNGCKSLKEVTLSHSIVSIGNESFRECGFTSFVFPDNVNSIGFMSFADCTGFSSVHIPSTLTSIADAPFFSCNLDYITVDEDNSVYDSRNGCNAIIHTSNNRLIQGSNNTIIPDDVTIIAARAFSGCQSLSSFDIPLSVKTISDWAYSGCISLTEVVIPSTVTNIGASIFSRCTSLTKVSVDEGNPVYDSREDCNGIIETSTNTIVFGYEKTVLPNTVTAIGKYAYYGCLGLTTLSLPSSVTLIDAFAFEFCQKLTSLTLHSSLTMIGSYAFGATRITKIVSEIENPFEIPENVFSDYVYSNAKLVVPLGTVDSYKNTAAWNKFVNITDNLSEPYAVLSEGNTVLTFFYDDKREERGGMSVGPFFLSIKWGWYDYRQSITSVIFNPSFAGCTSLTSTALWFYECSNLASISGIEYLKTDNVTDMLGMFEGCSSLTSLDVSRFKTDNVTNMRSMFYGCSGLTSLDVSGFKTDNVTNMNFMFGNCSSLTSLNVNGFKTDNLTGFIYMFAGCSSLTSLDVSGFKTDNVTDMHGMFAGCSGLTSLDVSGFKTDNVSSMQAMFWGCSRLTSLDVSSFNTANVTDMTSMFENCSSLACIQMGNAKIPGDVLSDIGNPNLLVYVNSSEAVPSGIQNVVVNNEAEEIVLTFTWEGNGNFYCPKQFVAHKIRYTHEFNMQTEIGVSRGWETIALPFTVQSITHEKNGPLVPFGAEGGKPFWLGQMTPQGLVSAQQIVANTPYVISMPNNALYPENYNQAGAVTFSATDCVVPMTEQHAVTSNNCTLVPTFQNVEKSPDVYAINLYDAYGSHPEGSIFVANLREVRPFEAYTLHSSGSRAFISIDELMADPTGIKELEVTRNVGNEKVYNLKGQRLATPQKGLNIMNGRKVIVK